MTKDTTLYCRITNDLKEQLDREARLRGESASLIVREALREYFAAKTGSSETSAMQERPAKQKRAA